MNRKDIEDMLYIRADLARRSGDEEDGKHGHAKAAQFWTLSKEEEGEEEQRRSEEEQSCLGRRFKR